MSKATAIQLAVPAMGFDRSTSLTVDKLNPQLYWLLPELVEGSSTQT
jgi:hypothetical protein